MAVVRMLQKGLLGILPHLIVGSACQQVLLVLHHEFLGSVVSAIPFARAKALSLCAAFLSDSFTRLDKIS